MSTDIVAAFREFNTGIRNARADYEAHPTRSCLWPRDRPCYTLRTNDARYCRHHRSIANANNRAKRARKAAQG